MLRRPIFKSSKMMSANSSGLTVSLNSSFRGGKNWKSCSINFRIASVLKRTSFSEWIEN